MGLGPQLNALLSYSKDDGELVLDDKRVGVFDAEVVLLIYEEFHDIIGNAANRLVTEHIRSYYQEFFETTFPNATLDEMMSVIEETGYGSLRPITGNKFRAFNTVESQYYNEVSEVTDRETGCIILQSKMEAAFSVARDKPIRLEETICRSNGAEYCEFEVVADA